MLSQFVASMRHQTADRARRKQIAGHPAKDPFVEPAVAVGAGHQQIGSFVLGQADDLIRTRPMGLYFDPAFRLYPVLREITNDVINMMACGIHLVLPAYLHDGYAFGLVKERQRILNRSPRLPRILPSDHDMVGGQGFHCCRYHQERTAGSQDSGANIDSPIDIARIAFFDQDQISTVALRRSTSASETQS